MISNLFDEKLRFIKEHSQSVLNLGSGADKQLREFFDNRQYKTMDVDERSGADLIADAHKIPLSNGSTDAIISFSLIEHTHSPHVVVGEMHRILKPGGHALISTPFIHPYHGGHCPDYYRFSKDGLKYLFKDFSSVEIWSDGGFFLALKYFVPKSLEPLRFIINPILGFMDKMFTQHRSSGHQYYVFVKK